MPDRVGWTAGAGVEGMIAPNWLARVECRYANYGNNFSYTLMQGQVTNVDAISGNLKRSAARWWRGTDRRSALEGHQPPASARGFL